VISGKQKGPKDKEFVSKTVMCVVAVESIDLGP